MIGNRPSDRANPGPGPSRARPYDAGGTRLKFAGVPGRLEPLRGQFGDRSGKDTTRHESRTDPDQSGR